MKIVLAMCLISAAYAYPIPSLKNTVAEAAQTAQHLTYAQVTAIKAAVMRKIQKQMGLGRERDELQDWHKKAIVAAQRKAIAAASIINDKQIAKLAKESAIEQSQLQEAASRGGFGGLAERARKRVTSKPQRVAVLPDGGFLNGKRLFMFTDETIAAFKESRVLEQISPDGTTLINTKLGNQEKIVAISDFSLGRGINGDTFLAQDVTTKEYIAFKRLKPHIKTADSEEIGAWRSQSMLKTEIVEFADGSKGFGMELLKGKTLKEAFIDARSLHQLRDIFERGIIAIKKMHQGGVAHGDAHTGNILTGGQMVDFGSIRPLNSDTLYEDFVTLCVSTSFLMKRLNTPLSTQFLAELNIWSRELTIAENQAWRLKKLQGIQTN
jgi:hypothetical protein